MTVDLAVATPAFLDLTLVGLEALPGPGEERFAGDLVRSPGGGAITAIGAARLGLSTALVSPLGEDVAGAFVAGALEREGVRVAAPRIPRTPQTVVLPADGERAMATYDPGVRASAADVAAVEPRAVAVGLRELDLAPPGARTYVSCGDEEARTFAGRLPAGLAAAGTLFVNRREALTLTGAATAEEAAAALGERVPAVIVTLGPAGALSHVEGRSFTASGFDTGPVVDTTGAGDLLCAAYAWADLGGADPEAALRWATLYASLSVGVPTGAAGALALESFVEEGRRRGLPALPSGKERVR
jgi:ribokinase